MAAIALAEPWACPLCPEVLRKSAVFSTAVCASSTVALGRVALGSVDTDRSHAPGKNEGADRLHGEGANS